MPEEQKPQQPDEETQKQIKNALEGLLGWVQAKKEAATPVAAAIPAAPATTPSKPWGWVVGLIVAAVVFIGLAVLAWYLWSKGRELAKLRHEKAEAEEAKHQAEVQSQLTVLEDHREALETQAAVKEGQIITLTEAIQKAEAERQAAQAKLDTLTSWDDVDRMIKGK